MGERIENERKREREKGQSAKLISFYVWNLSGGGTLCLLVTMKAIAKQFVNEDALATARTVDCRETNEK